jgi:hypothetical protein
LGLPAIADLNSLVAFHGQVERWFADANFGCASDIALGVSDYGQRICYDRLE